MSRGSITGYAVASNAWATVFDALNGDGPGCTTFEGANVSSSAPDLLFMRVTDKAGIQSILTIPVGSKDVARCSINGIIKVEMRFKSGTDVAYAAPAAWGAESI